MRTAIAAVAALGLVGALAVPADARLIGETASSATPTAFGISDSTDGARSARFTNWTGTSPQGVRIFYNTVPTKWNVKVPGAIVSFSFKTGTPAEVTAFEKTRPSGTQCTGTFWHEPENDSVWQGASGAAAYRAKWAQYGPAIRDGGCTPTLILMRWSLSPGSHENWTDYYSAASVDLLAFDAYNGGQKNGKYADPVHIVGPMAQLSATTGKPWAITETGSPAIGGNYAARAAWAARLAAEIAQPSSGLPGAQFADWWDSGGPGFDNTLDVLAARAWHN